MVHRSHIFTHIRTREYPT